MASNDQNLSQPAASPPSAEDSDRLLIDLHVARSSIERARVAIGAIAADVAGVYDPDVDLARCELDQAEAAVTRAIGRRRAHL
jgi:hypothetical protein